MLVIPPILVGSSYEPSTRIPEGALEVWFDGTNFNVFQTADLFVEVPVSPKLSIVTMNTVPFTAPGDGFSGMHFNNPMRYTHPFPIGMDFLRLHDIAGEGVERGRWNRLNTANGVYDWTWIDQVINRYYTEVPLLYTIISTPTWASARPGESGGYGLGNAAEPASMTYLVDFLTAFATRYLGKIKYYEVWNEPNLPAFYTGTHAKLAEMMRVCYQTLKAIDPEIQIISPAVTSLVAGTGITYFTDFCNASDGAGGFGRDWMDIVGVHLYSSGSTNQLTNAFPMIANFKAAVVAQGLEDLPLWNTEVGLLSPDAKDMGGDKLRHMKYSVIAALAHGFDMWFYYTYDNGTMGIDNDPDLAAEWDNFMHWMKGKTVGIVNRSGGRMYAVINGTNWII